MPATRDGPDSHGRVARRHEVAAFVRTLALVTSGTWLALLVFAAAQGALDGDPTTVRYWAKWWPVWLPAVPVALALATAVAGRVGSSLAWSGVAFLLVGGTVIVRLAALG